MAGQAGRSGGRRPGAGRKPRAERFATAITRTEKRIADRLPDLVDSLFDLAEGVRVKECNAEGKPVVYVRPPDAKAAIYLIDRILGKPTAQVEAEITGKGGGPIEFREVVVEMPPDDDESEGGAAEPLEG